LVNDVIDVNVFIYLEPVQASKQSQLGFINRLAYKFFTHSLCLPLVMTATTSKYNHNGQRRQKTMQETQS